MMRQVHSAPHPRVANVLRDYGQLLMRAGRLDSAAAMLERSVTMYRRERPPDPPAVHTATLRLGAVRLRQERPRRADSLARAVLDGTGDKDSSRVRTGRALQILADVARRQVRPGRADSLSAAAVQAYRAAGPSARWRTAVVHVRRGRGRMARGDYPAAESLLVRAYDRLCHARGTPDHYTKRARRALASLYDASDRPETARRSPGDLDCPSPSP